MNQVLAMTATATALQIRSAARTHVGRVRAVNEDRMLDLPERGLWAVADGMGGHAAGGAAATDAVRALCTLAAQDVPGVDAVDQALAQAHAAIRAAGDDRGTTIAGLLLDGTRFTAFWIGDSRVYRLRERSLEQLSHDHSLVQELVDSGTLTPAQAARHPHANVITRAIGIDAWSPCEAVGGEAQRRDRFLICSDGLSSLVDAGMIAAALAGDPIAAADGLVSAALDAGGTDNVTAIVIALD